MKTNIKEKKHIVNFIKSLVNKDYSSANTSLQEVLHEKIKHRINLAATKPLFKS